MDQTLFAGASNVHCFGAGIMGVPLRIAPQYRWDLAPALDVWDPQHSLLCLIYMGLVYGLSVWAVLVSDAPLLKGPRLRTPA